MSSGQTDVSAVPVIPDRTDGTTGHENSHHTNTARTGMQTSALQCADTTSCRAGVRIMSARPVTQVRNQSHKMFVRRYRYHQTGHVDSHCGIREQSKRSHAGPWPMPHRRRYLLIRRAITGICPVRRPCLTLWIFQKFVRSPYLGISRLAANRYTRDPCRRRPVANVASKCANRSVSRNYAATLVHRAVRLT